MSNDLGHGPISRRLVELEQQLVLTMAEIVRLAGWSGWLRLLDRAQRHACAKVKENGRQGEGGWIF